MPILTGVVADPWKLDRTPAVPIHNNARSKIHIEARIVLYRPNLVSAKYPATGKKHWSIATYPELVIMTNTEEYCDRRTVAIVIL